MGQESAVSSKAACSMSRCFVSSGAEVAPGHLQCLLMALTALLRVQLWASNNCKALALERAEVDLWISPV